MNSRVLSITVSTIKSMNDNNQQLPKPSAPLAGGKKQKARTKKEKVPPVPSSFGTKVVRDSRDSDAPASRFNYVFHAGDAQLRDYLKTVFHPKQYAYGVPAETGGFELFTKTWRTFDAGTAFAGADGIATVGVVCDSWLEDGNYEGRPHPSCQVLSYSTSGAAVIASKSATLTYGPVGCSPSTGTLFSSGDYNSTPLSSPLDANFTDNTRMRLVAVELEVKSVQASNNAKGEIMLFGSVNPQGGVQGGTLNTATWNDILNTPNEVISRSRRTIPNWKPDQVFSVVAIPAEDQAFMMVKRPSSSLVNMTGGYYGVMTLGMIARNLSPGDSLEYEVTYVWESELSKTKEANQSYDEKVPLPISTLLTATSKARPYSTQGRVPGISDLPWIDTLSVTNPQAISALAKHPKVPSAFRPLGGTKEMVIYNPPMMSPQPPGSFLDKVAGVAKGALHAISDTGLLSNVPVIGKALQAGASWLDSIFGR